MKNIIGIYAQESGNDGWVLSTKKLQDIYNDGLPKTERIDIITTYNLTFELEEFLTRRCILSTSTSKNLTVRTYTTSP